MQKITVKIEDSIYKLAGDTFECMHMNAYVSLGYSWEGNRIDVVQCPDCLGQDLDEFQSQLLLDEYYENLQILEEDD